MKLRNPWLIRAVATVAAWVIRLWMATVRYRVVNGDVYQHPADAERQRFVYTFWHESLLAPVKFKARASILISKHADGELIAQVAERLGFDTVRGSSTRGGGTALVALWHCSHGSHLVFHPDGPRGPRRGVQPGVVTIASKTGLPIVPVGVGYSRAWRARSWDRFALPLPFSLVVFHATRSIHVPSEIDRETLEQYRQTVEQQMLEVTEAAERLASRSPAASVSVLTPAPHLKRGRSPHPSHDRATSAGGDLDV